MDFLLALRAEMGNNLLMALLLVFIHEVHTNNLIVTDLFVT